MKDLLVYAAKGNPHAYPNPLVACFIVHDHKIVSRGYHEKYGQAHAEVNAIRALPIDISPEHCTLYVNLEPCSHFGKTPPCADLIIEKGFKKVVIANKDPNPLVSGKGIEKLKSQGIELIEGVLEEEGRALNKRFFTFHENKRPHIILKWAETADGFISKLPVPENRSENMISTPEQLIETHQIRAGVDAIFIGKNTAIYDNPELTTRLVEGKNPIRIILDKNLDVPPTHHIFNQAAKTIIFNSKLNSEKDNIQFVQLDFSQNILKHVFAYLYANGIQSVLVEGGKKLLENCLEENYTDEVIIHRNPDKYFGTGLTAPKYRLIK